MAKVVVASDLHLGITDEATIRKLANAIGTENPDLTVLAGDIGEGLANIQACLELFAHLPGDVAVLAGNHDVWKQANISSQTLWERDLPGVVKDAGMIWLEETAWQRGAVAVVGSLSWYDYSAADPTLPRYRSGFFAALKRDYNMDAAYVDWPWSDRAFAERLGEGLCTRLQRLEDDPAVRSVLIATHVPLFEEQMLRKPEDFAWGFSNAYFGNLTLGEQVAKKRKVRMVISGHTHVGMKGLVRRPDSDGDPFPVSVLASDYHAPTYVAIDTETLEEKIW